MLVATLMLAGLIAAALTFLAFRIVKAVRPLHEPTTRWVRRSEIDRRQRSVPVAVERRRGPRREEDVAAQFLHDLRRLRAPRPARRPG